jgi:hypothetical protein
MKTMLTEDCAISELKGSSIEQWLSTMYGTNVMFNASAVRARAGILNIIIGITISILLAKPELDPVVYAAPYLLFDMVIAISFGLTPACPTGIMGTWLTRKTRATSTPHLPKRFAWALGASLACMILVLRLFHFHGAWLIGALSTFFLLTWLDAVLGFCVGCWIYSKLFHCEECQIG